MKYILITLEGVKNEKEINYAVITNQDGELAILKNHIPIVLSMEKGHIRLMEDNDISFVYIEQGVVKFSNNILEVLSVEAFQAKTLEEATSGFMKDREFKIEEEKKANVDFSKQERELRENIAKSRAGQR